MGWESLGANLGANVLGAIATGVGGRSAARQQERQGRAAVDLTDQAQKFNYADLAPYRNLGAGATDRMAVLLGVGGDRNDPRYGELTRRFQMSDYEQDPGYQFRLSEGENAINRNALAKGRYNSGSVLKELQGYNSNLASQEFGNAFDRWRAQNNDIYGRLGDASGRGQRAVEVGNADRTQATNRIGDIWMGIGNARGAASTSLANSFINGANNMANWTSGQNALRNPRTPNYFPPGMSPDWGNGYGINLGSGRE